MKFLFNERGSSLVGALILVTLLGYMGASLLNLGGTDSSGGANDMQSVQALEVGNGGIQYALDRLNQGESPVVTNKALARGSFTVATNPAAQQLTVTGTVGNATKRQTMNADFSSSCVDLVVTGAYVSSSGKSINGLEVVKTCNAKATITTMAVTWNFSACAQALVCDGNTVSEPPAADPADNKVTICHIPPGNPANLHTISVGASAVPAHQTNHGDLIGACPGSPATPLVCEGYETQVAACGVSTGGLTLKSMKLSNTFLLSGGTAASGSTIDVTDYTLVTNGTYMLEPVTWSGALSANSWYQFRVDFADGSSITKSFKFGS